jgi:hypothetical protein
MKLKTEMPLIITNSKNEKRDDQNHRYRKRWKETLSKSRREKLKKEIGTKLTFDDMKKRIAINIPNG